ncbi:MAG: hypothetical protein Q4C44_03080 [bacterium]|nr:hypothetical protein [bacterium]
MKKALLLIIMLFPCFVDAKVDQDTPTTIIYLKDESDAKTKCLDAVKNNDSSVLTKGTAGYYLECVEVSCNSSKNSHKTLNNVSVSCANGNTKPNAIINSGALQSDIKEGTTCNESGAYLYYTQKIYFNCSYNQDNSEYVPVNNDNNTDKDGNQNNNPGNQTNNSEKSPNTGVEDYYLVLGVGTVVLVTLLFVLNKKNVFKKI